MHNEKNITKDRFEWRLSLMATLMLLALIAYGVHTIGLESAQIESKEDIIRPAEVNSSNKQIFAFNNSCFPTESAGSQANSEDHLHAGNSLGHILPTGRFSVCTWPPQPKNITNVIWDNTTASIMSRKANQARIARQVAEEDRYVQLRLGDRFTYIMSTPVQPKKWEEDISGYVVTFFSYSNNQTIEALVEDTKVIKVEVFNASKKQPTLQKNEVTVAINIARQYWQQEGVIRVNKLEGYAIQTLQTEGAGGFYDSRMVYVTFHVDEKSAPELLTWIDLTNETVVLGTQEKGFEQERKADGSENSVWMPIARADEDAGNYEPFDGIISGEIDWQGWEFDYELGLEGDGLSISNVRYQGAEIMSRGAFPAMPVYYEDNNCGPFIDIIIYTAEVDWAPSTNGIVSREFMIDGEVWYELGARTIIGQYDIYQVWYISPDGIIDAHLFSRGLECSYFHEHYPHWRFDFDINGSGNDQILRQTSSGFEAMTTEFDVTADTAEGHGWVVRDTQTDYQVNLSLDPGTWNVPDTVIPQTMDNKNRVAGRLNREGEVAWTGAVPADWGDGAGWIPYGNNEKINDTDLVVWYSGYLPHEASDGATLWHSTGVRLTLAENGTAP